MKMLRITVDGDRLDLPTFFYPSALLFPAALPRYCGCNSDYLSISRMLIEYHSHDALATKHLKIRVVAWESFPWAYAPLLRLCNLRANESIVDEIGDLRY